MDCNKWREIIRSESSDIIVITMQWAEYKLYVFGDSSLWLTWIKGCLLQCMLAAAQCIVIGPVCGSVTMII